MHREATVRLIFRSPRCESARPRACQRDKATKAQLRSKDDSFLNSRIFARERPAGSGSSASRHKSHATDQPSPWQALLSFRFSTLHTADLCRQNPLNSIERQPKLIEGFFQLSKHFRFLMIG